MKKLYLTLSLALMCSVAFAVPAKRGLWKTVKLADGTEVRVELRGDEFCRFWQAEDGSVYVQSAKTNVYEKAELSALLKQAEAVRAKANEARAMRAPGNGKAAPNRAKYEGTKKGLIILAQFPDMQFQEEHTKELYQRIANEEGFSEMGFKGSIKDYFKAQSYGTFELDFDIAGPVTLPESYAYYGENKPGTSGGAGEYYDRMAEFVIESCKGVEDEVDFTQYDWNGDGEIDQVFILFAGRGEASGGDENTIWPHEFTLKGAMGYQYNVQRPSVDGVRINTYACGCELGQYGTIDGIGTVCHEFSHCLGLMDMYDTQYSGGYGLNAWSIMASGNYNGDSFVPAGFTSFEKMQAGWLQPIELDSDQRIENMQSLAETKEAYIIYNDNNNNEYYLLENRVRVGWDAELPNAGLLITHVDYNSLAWQNNFVNSPGGHSSIYLPNPHERCAVVQADEGARNNMPSGDVWPYMRKKDFTKDTTPAATVYTPNTDGSYNLNKSVTGITKNSDYTINFDFSIDGGGGTGISGVTVDGAVKGDGRVYSLDGRYLGNDLDALQKGIYIVNGKKIVK